MVEVVEVDPHDDAALREYWETEQSAIRHDRPEAITRTWDFFRSSTTTPGAFHRRELLAARVAGRTVGVADLGFWLRDNDHLTGLEVNVLAGHRRRGIGRELAAEAERRRRAAGRTAVCGEAYVPHGQAPDTTPAWLFARATGMSSVHQEDHLVLVPSGGLDVQAVVWDEDRLRSGEQRTSRSFHQVIAAARSREDGALVGYSQLYLPHGESHVLQDDTLVMPVHRGHRLGTLLKLSSLAVLQREHPERRTVHTWTDPDNVAMYRTNVGFGYVATERMHEMQRRDGG